ncbi:MAG: lysylphosphatidylglycerol synthase transmembrane domain-containing protein [Chthoniobacteraceae bacterium]
MKTWLFRILQAALTIGLLWWIFSRPDFMNAARASVHEADWRWLAAGLALALADQVLNIVRWAIYLRIQRIDASWGKITQVFMGGLFFNLILPGMVSGDVLKMALFGQQGRGHWRPIMLSIVADRLIGLIALVVFTLAIVLWRYQWLSQTALATGLLWGLIVFTVLSILFLVASFAFSGQGALEKLPARFPGRKAIIEMGGAWHLFVEKWRASLVAVVLSFPVLFTYFGVFWCGARAFRAPVSLLDLCSVMPVITVGTSLPISFSGIGVREEMFKHLLHDLANVPAEKAVLISLAGFAIYAVCGIIGLFFCMADLPEVFELMRKKGKKGAEAAPSEQS